MNNFKERLRAIGKPRVFGLYSLIDFGQFRGKTVKEVIDRYDPKYIEWCLREKIFELDNAAFLHLRECIDLLNAETQRREDDNNDDFSLRFGPHKYYE